MAAQKWQKNNGVVSVNNTETTVKTSRLSMMILSIFLTAFLVAAYISNASAMPPYTGEALGKIAANRFADSYYLNHQDELAERGVNVPGALTNTIDNLSKRLAKSGSVNNINILTILVGFSDNTPQVSAAFFDTLIYTDRTGTVNNYYQENSYNSVAITTVVLPSTIGWKTMSQTYAYYVDAQNGFGTYPKNVQKIVEEAVDAANASVDFSDYDNDSDGYVDGLIIVHAGPGAEFTGSDNDIWSHMWAISPRLRDGVYIYEYSMEPEYWSSTGDMTCGVYCHELGHVFGLPDLYDTDYTSIGVGYWSLMAGGSWNGTLGDSPAHFDAWSKIQLGYVTPTVVAYDQTSNSIPAVESNATVYKLWTNGSPGTQYFLVENRQLSGYDAELPSSGLLIWHVDESMSSNDNEWWPTAGASSHYKVALEQADGLWQMEKNASSGNIGDPYPGSTVNRTFNASSTPNSNNYASGATSVAVTNISNSAATMTADFAVGATAIDDDGSYSIPDKAVLYLNYPNPFNAVTTISFQLLDDANVSVSVYDINGRLIQNIAEGRYAAGFYKIDWSGTNRFGHELSTGVYFYTVSVDGIDVSRKMLYLK